MSTFRLSILESDSEFYVGECSSLVVPTTEGQYGVLAHHSNTIIAVVTGMMKFTLPDGVVRIAAVSGGIMRIRDNEVLVLVDTAERPEDIDVNRARRAAAEAKESMLQKRSFREYRMAKDKIARELNRLRIKNKE